MDTDLHIFAASNRANVSGDFVSLPDRLCASFRLSFWRKILGLRLMKNAAMNRELHA
jgi:hypothetical protein